MKFRVDMPGLTELPRRDSPWDTGLAAPDFQRYAEAVDRMGYDGIKVSEHMAMPLDRIPELGPKFPHAFAAMSFIAGATRRIRVTANVLVLPYYEPIGLAKAVSTVDLMSGGRVILSIGIGNTQNEFAALGIPFDSRGRRADEMLTAMKLLWSEENPKFKGEFFAFQGIRSEPKPVQKPYPEIWIGGKTKPAMRRAARFGDLWNPQAIALEDIPKAYDYMKSQPEWAARKRPLGLFKIVDAIAGDYPSDQQLVDAVGALARAGVTWTALPMRPDRSIDERLDQLQRLADNVVSKCR